MTRFLAISGLVGLALIAQGCGRPLIRGVVVDTQGEPLPGVAVEIVGADRQAVTDARGEYSIRSEPGSRELAYFKTGYTPGRMAIEVTHGAPIDATTIALWRLPQQGGVYLYENFRYHAAKAVEPQVYHTEGGGDVYGTEVWDHLETTNTKPVILCYRMPRYDARLHELKLIEVTGRADKPAETPFMIWAAGHEVPTRYLPVDEPDGILMELTWDDPLEPGVYAVHWNILDGRGAQEPRVFVFDVTEKLPEPAAESAPESGGEKAEESEDAGADQA